MYTRDAVEALTQLTVGIATENPTADWLGRIADQAKFLREKITSLVANQGKYNSDQFFALVNQITTQNYGLIAEIQPAAVHKYLDEMRRAMTRPSSDAGSNAELSQSLERASASLDAFRFAYDAFLLSRTAGDWILFLDAALNFRTIEFVFGDLLFGASGRTTRQDQRKRVSALFRARRQRQRIGIVVSLDRAL